MKISLLIAASIVHPRSSTSVVFLYTKFFSQSSLRFQTPKCRHLLPLLDHISVPRAATIMAVISRDPTHSGTAAIANVDASEDEWFRLFVGVCTVIGTIVATVALVIAVFMCMEKKKRRTREERGKHSIC